MSTIEIALGIALAITVWLLIRLYRKHLILRHVFVHSSNWCARKIDEVTASASQCIISLATEFTAGSDQPLSEDDAKQLIYVSVTQASIEWREQMYEFQDQLARNGIRPLDENDLDRPFLNPGLIGLKS